MSLAKKMREITDRVTIEKLIKFKQDADKAISIFMVNMVPEAEDAIFERAREGKEYFQRSFNLCDEYIQLKLEALRDHFIAEGFKCRILRDDQHNRITFYVNW